MHDHDTTPAGDTDSAAQDQTDQAQPRRRRASSRAAGPPVAPESTSTEVAEATAGSDDAPTGEESATATTPRRRTRKAPAKKAASAVGAESAPATSAPVESAPADAATADAAADTDAAASSPDAATDAPAKKAAPRKRASRSRKTAATATSAADEPANGVPSGATATEPAAQPTASSDQSAPAAEAAEAGHAAPEEEAAAAAPRSRRAAAPQAAVLFQPPTFQEAELSAAKAAAKSAASPTAKTSADPDADVAADEAADTSLADAPTSTEVADTDDGADADADADDESGAPRRRRRRGGRGRRRKADDAPEGESSEDDASRPAADAAPEPAADTDDDSDTEEEGDGGTRRRRRRRKRRGDGEGDDVRPDDPPNTVVRVRDSREVDDEVTSVKGSTRLEAKKQRRREGREAGRRRPPILSEAEFLARREAVDRVMAVRQSGDLTQIAVLEDDVLVEHYVSRASQQSLIGNVYLGRVQNVLPAMEAAFVDIGRGRNAVLYAGEVDWSGMGKADGPKRIEDVLKSGQPVLVQVTKDPIGHKGARLTGQVSLPGRYVVYVPGGSMSGISRKLPDTERTRLKKILKQVVPEDAGVIVRTAAEGASEEELTNDVSRLQAQWEAIQKKAAGNNAPSLLQGEPDLAIKVVRDLFNEDFAKLVVSGDGAWETIDEYVTSVAGSLHDRVEKWTSNGDVFAAFRIDEQIAKALDRKVWLPSGGSLVIDRTEAMTVVDVNTGKFTGSGGNLEETVTKNNLEAAEEIVRQLRLRDIGGIIVIDFIDMVLEANRDLVLRRLVECLGRDRTKHQVAEVTSLGLVQMTRKRIGTGLLEAFSEPCPHCNGRGVVLHAHPIESDRQSAPDDGPSRSERRGRRRRGEQAEKAPVADTAAHAPKLEALAEPGAASPADLIPVANGAEHAEGSPEPAGSSDGEPAGSSASAPSDGQPAAVAQPSEAAQAAQAAPESPPAGRGRRRARRPAGKPEPQPTGADDASGESSEPAADTAPATAATTAEPSGPVGGPVADSVSESVADTPAASPSAGSAAESTAEPVSAPDSTSDAAPEKAPARRPRRRAERPSGKPDAVSAEPEPLTFPTG